MAAAIPIQPQIEAPLPRTKTTGPCVMVIFGATGDLTKRKLLPSIYNLLSEGLLSREFAIVGMARDELNTEEFRKRVGDALREFCPGADPELVDWLVVHSYYVTGEFGDAEAYKRLRAQLAEVDKSHGTHQNYFFYLAIAPQFFASAVEKLGESALSEEENGSWSLD